VTVDADEFAAAVAAAKAGDVDAWSRVVVAFGPMVAAYVRAVDFADPDEEVSRMFEEAGRGVDCFEGTADEFRLFLFDIAVAHRRASGSSDAAPHGGSGDTANRPPRAPVVARLARLHPDVRDAILLARIADLEPRAIADILEVDHETVVEWQRQGLESLDR